MTEFVGIAPIPHLSELNHQQMYLALMHLCWSTRYTEYYQGRSDYNRYVILDNSLHEGHVFEIIPIVAMAEQISAKEIIIPDAVEDGEETLRKTERAFMAIAMDRDTQEILQGLRPAFHVVPHGKDIAEWLRCLRRLIGLYDKMKIAYPTLFTQPLVIGFPAQYAYNVFNHGDCESVVKALKVAQREHKVQCHILGWDRTPFDHVPWLLRQMRWRSVDTSKPFSFALYGPEVPYPARGRTPDFFTDTLPPDRLHEARANLEMFRNSVTYNSMMGKNNDR